MDWTTFCQGFFSTASPHMPSAGALVFGFGVSWAIVLGALGVWLSRSWHRPYRLALVGMLMLVTLLPGTWSPDYWLGLAFQIPSFATVGICSYVMAELLLSTRGQPSGLTLVSSQIRALEWLALAGMVLGWLLLLDTLALLPFPIYNWGFSPAAMAAMALLAVLPWLVRPLLPGAQLVTLLALLALTLYALTRLPDGNLWDALMDPLLWVALQWILLRRFARSLKARWSASAATRA